MMIAPNCPDHDRLALDLALGRLDDDTAVEVEAVCESCPVCRTWWSEQLGDAATAMVDGAVAAALDDLRLPARRRSHGWMAAAAVLVMALGVATLWLTRNPAPAAPAIVERTAAIQRLDFEVPEVVGVAEEDAAEPVEELVEPEPRFVSAARIDPEVGDDVVLVEAAPVEVPTAAEPQPLFAGGFESGNLEGWVPST